MNIKNVKYAKNIFLPSENCQVQDSSQVWHPSHHEVSIKQTWDYKQKISWKMRKSLFFDQILEMEPQNKKHKSNSVSK